MNGSTAQSLQPRLWLQMRSQAQMAARIFWLHCFNSGSRQQTARLFNVFVLFTFWIEVKGQKIAVC